MGRVNFLKNFNIGLRTVANMSCSIYSPYGGDMSQQIGGKSMFSSLKGSKVSSTVAVIVRIRSLVLDKVSP